MRDFKRFKVKIIINFVSPYDILLTPKNLIHSIVVQSIRSQFVMVRAMIKEKYEMELIVIKCLKHICNIFQLYNHVVISSILYLLVDTLFIFKFLTNGETLSGYFGVCFLTSRAALSLTLYFSSLYNWQLKVAQQKD